MYLSEYFLEDVLVRIESREGQCLVWLLPFEAPTAMFHPIDGNICVLVPYDVSAKAGQYLKTRGNSSIGVRRGYCLNREIIDSLQSFLEKALRLGPHHQPIEDPFVRLVLFRELDVDEESALDESSACDRPASSESCGCAYARKTSSSCKDWIAKEGLEEGKRGCWESR